MKGGKSAGVVKTRPVGKPGMAVTPKMAVPRPAAKGKGGKLGRR